MRPRSSSFACLGVFLAIAAFTACSSSSNSTGSSGGAGDDGGGTLPDGAPIGDDGGGGADGTSPPPPPGPGMKTTHESMQVNGTTRTYILAVPATYDAARAYPLVMVLHGNPGTADGMLATYPFDGASKQDAVLVYPDGMGNNWDLYTTPPASNADMPFIQALPAEVGSKVHVDTTRVFGSGYSGGAFFLNQMACLAPGTFKAFASHSGGAPYEPNNPPSWPNGCLKCAAGPTPAILLHGLADPEVDPSGSKYASACWATTNGCANTDPTTWPATTPTPCVKDDSCAAASPVEMCLVAGLGHEQWSQGAVVAWDFFKSIP